MKIKLSRKFLAIVSILSVLFLVGLGFLSFYSFVIPKLTNLSTLSLMAVVGFSLLAGGLSFFAPCSLAIFPSYIGYYLSESGENTRMDSLRLGIVASLGMVTFYGLLGVTVSFIGGLSSVQTILKIGIPVMAGILGLVGIYFLIGRTIKGTYLTKAGSKFITRENSTTRNLFLFGVGYSMSSIACIFPVFLLLVSYPLITGDFILGVTAFLSFSAGKSLLMILATVLTSESKSQVLVSKSHNFQYIKRGSGLLLVAVALYLVYYSLALHGIIQPI